MDMDPSLRKVREDVMESRAWSQLQRELLAKMRRSQHLAGERQLRTLDSLSTREKRAALERAVEELGETSAYASLQDEVGIAVDRHFSSHSFQQGASPPPRQAAHPLADACSRLLEESPHLKHSLKQALNHPLPSKLRLSAWKLLLCCPTVQNHHLATGKGAHPRNEAEREVVQRCQSILGSNPVFADIAENSSYLLAMQSVMLYWKQRTSGCVLDSKFLLCIPFIYVWREELERYRGSREKWPLFAEIAGVYVRFMEMLPPSIVGAASAGSSDGMSKFSRRVEELLHKEDTLLHKALQRLFQKTAGNQHSVKSTHRDNRDGFCEHLKSILLPHIQKMLVGDITMDVLCYIWDQCFIGLDVPEYQCLPYFTTVWLILLRDRLLKATSIEAVEETLSVHSLSLTTIQFQQQMENRFLTHLSSLLRVKPILRHPLPLLPPTLSPHSQHHLSHSSHHPSSHSSHRHTSCSTQTIKAHTLQNLPKGGGARAQSAQWTSLSGDNVDMHFIHQRMEEMQERVEREQRILSCKIREEREQQQTQLELIKRELAELKIVGLDRGRRVVQDQSLRNLQSPTIQSSPSKQPTKLLVDASRASSSKSDGVALQIQDTRSLRVIPADPSSQQQLLSENDSRRRPFSPSNLSERDVQILWLKVLKRFTTAAYTICHGTGSEKQALFSAIQSSTSTES